MNTTKVTSRILPFAKGVMAKPASMAKTAVRLGLDPFFTADVLMSPKPIDFKAFALASRISIKTSLLKGEGRSRKLSFYELHGLIDRTSLKLEIAKALLERPDLLKSLDGKKIRIKQFDVNWKFQAPGQITNINAFYIGEKKVPLKFPVV